MKVILENVEKKYNKKKIINNFSHQFKKNEINLILGESGSGKTTLLNIIAQFLEADSGNIIFNEQYTNLLNRRMKNQIIKKDIGYIYQDFRLFENLTVEKNLRLALKFSKIPKNIHLEKINSILMEFGLSDLKENYVHTLSGGEKQRISIARAVISEKSLILADEPTGNLDTNNTQKVIELFKKINLMKKTTFIIITHSSQVAENFEKNIVYLKDGNKVL